MISSPLPLYALCFIVSFAVSLVCGKALIPRLARLGAQPIYEEGPAWHASKRGTPTMGGVCFVIGVLLSLLPIAVLLLTEGERYRATSLILSVAYALFNSVIGMIDDLKKLSKRENLGLTATEKLILQSVGAIVFLFLYSKLLSVDTVIRLPTIAIELGGWYYPVSFLLLVGITNFVNLTDGVDGLASSVCFACAVSLFYITYSTAAVGGFLSSALAGGVTAFLIFNLHPATVFMGDTGSLFLGSLLSSMTVSLNNPFFILPIYTVFVLEGLSVVLQVLSFKLFKKRIFKMAPLHHHLEKSGWSENKICITGMLVTFVFSLIAIILYSL